MKNFITMLLLTALLFTLSACSDTRDNDNLPQETQTEELETKEETEMNTPKLPLENPFESFGMPVAFYEVQNGGGLIEKIRFSSLVSHEISDTGIGSIGGQYIYRLFGTEYDDGSYTIDDIFSDWTESPEMNRYWSEPVTGLMEYANFYSFIREFNWLFVKSSG